MRVLEYLGATLNETQRVTSPINAPCGNAMLHEGFFNFKINYMKLISMTDYVLEAYEKIENDREFSDKVFQYATFLKKPLQLGMFVPCDDDDNILHDPGLIPSYELEQYCKAKEKVIFEGFDVREQSTYSIVSSNVVDGWITWN